MGKLIDGYVFNDFCQRCQKVMAHNIELEAKDSFGVCGSCNERRPIKDPNQVYYPKTDLWVTRFRIGNLPCVVSGKLLERIRQAD